MKLEKILLIATGGTIAMRKDQHGKAVPAVSGFDLLESIPNLREQTQWEIVDFSNVASCNMSPKKMLDLARIIETHFKDSSIKGVIITHGTDTLEETAYFLDLTIHDPRPIILTASQRDASEWDSDGPRNLRNAMLIAKNEQAVGRGVVIALNEEIHPARDVRKLHTSHVDAFNSGESGALGGIDNEEVIWYRKPEPSVKFGIPQRLANVVICKVFTGMSPYILECLLNTSIDGLVIEAFGRGNLPPELMETIQQFIARKIPVVVTSRCLFGRTAPTYGYPGGGADLERAGAWFASDLSTEKVRLIMSIALGLGMEPQELKEILVRGGIQ